MRILFLNPSGKLGGAETSLLNLLKGLRELHPQWRLILLLGEYGEMAMRAAALDVEIRMLPLPDSLARSGDGAPGKLLGAATATWRYRTRLGEEIRRIRPDVIHTNGFKMHLLGAWTAHGRSSGHAALICHLHDYVGSRPVTRRLMAASIGRFDAVVTNSASVAADVMKLPVRKERVVSIHNGIDIARFSPGGPALNLDALGEFAPTRPDVVQVGMLATFAKWKGHTTFLRAISLLPENLRVRAYVVGGPIYRTAGSQHTLEELRAEAERLGIGAKVCFTGFIEETPMALRALDIVVHASTEPEPFGMAIVEAMACGKPVIASLAGGAAEIFEDGVTALGHTPGDAAGLARQIETLANDAALRARLGANARVAVAARFQLSLMAERFAKVYIKAAGDGESTEPLRRSA